MKKLLVIGFVWPEPTSSAAGSRMMQLLNFFLSENYQITFVSAAQKTDYSAIVPNITYREIQLNDSGFDDFLMELQPDVVLFDRLMTEEQFGWRVSEVCPKAMKILDTEDLHFLRKARYKAVKENRKLQETDLFSLEAEREIASILRCDLSLIISEYEMELLENQFQIKPEYLYYLPLVFSESELGKITNNKTFTERKNLVFIGNFLHEPNWDAVLQLKKYWAAIRKQNPTIEVEIYGAYSSEKVKQLHDSKNGFFIKGRSKSAREVIENARLLIAPLRFGAGLKGKVLEAMLVGTPVVTTKIGAEGIAGNFPFAGEIYEGETNFIHAIEKLYDDELLWNEKQQFGYEILGKRFHESIFTKGFHKKIEQIQNTLLAHRQQNFYGTMLQHHSRKSTKYMSLWIEAKNKN
ncbi:glycosyltransferase [Mesonia sp. K7]|uniref:glycosyltransferase n=1 Tax=Mesonia sp. K7 TaxID=2218606 RepID=UPI000DA8EFA6|nr:glycosyltransferase [Mesonia sp. K7]PZD76500.1 glycosyltransferase [Mesonia sp. K7]